MKKQLLLTAALTAGLLFGLTPQAHAFSPFGLMATLASDSDTDDMPVQKDKAAQADAAAHDEIIADDSEQSGDDRVAATTTTAATHETVAQAKYAAAMEPAGR